MGHSQAMTGGRVGTQGELLASLDGGLGEHFKGCFSCTEPPGCSPVLPAGLGTPPLRLQVTLPCLWEHGNTTGSQVSPPEPCSQLPCLCPCLPSLPGSPRGPGRGGGVGRWGGGASPPMRATVLSTQPLSPLPGFGDTWVWGREGRAELRAFCVPCISPPLQPGGPQGPIPTGWLSGSGCTPSTERREHDVCALVLRRRLTHKDPGSLQVSVLGLQHEAAKAHGRVHDRCALSRLRGPQAEITVPALPSEAL